jgi:hypothetical protein
LKESSGKLPKLPKTLKELVQKGIPPKYQKTAGGKPFLRYIFVIQFSCTFNFNI